MCALPALVLSAGSSIWRFSRSISGQLSSPISSRRCPVRIRSLMMAPYSSSPDARQTSVSSLPVRTRSRARLGRPRANAEGRVVLAVASLDGPAEDAAQCCACAIGGYFALAAGDIVDNRHYGLPCDALHADPVKRLPVSLKLPLHLGVVARSPLGPTISEVPRYQLAKCYAALFAGGALYCSRIGAQAGLG